jgi:hypothetical protein
LAIVAIVWLLSNLSKPELTGIAIFIFIFSLIYLVNKMVKKKNILAEKSS